MRASAAGEMRRVEEVIDAWFDSGAMPFAQFHYPFENEDEFKERFPADYICEAQDQTRGWFYSLLAESTLLFDQTSYRNCVCLGPDPRPRGPEDVEEPRQRRRPVGGPRHPRRRRVSLVPAQHPAAVGRLPLLGRDVGESLRQFLLTLWNTYSFFVLYANAEGARRRGHRRGTAGAASARDRSIGGRSRGCRRSTRDRHRPHGRLRLHHGRARDRRLRRRALELVRAAQPAPLLGRRPRRVRDAAPLPGRAREAARAVRARSSPTRSTTTSAAAATPCTSPTSPSPTPSSRTASSRPASRRRCARSSSAAPPAREAKVKNRQPLRASGDRRHRGRARRDRAPRRARPRPSSTSRSSSSSPRRASSSPTRSSPTTATLGPALRQGDAAGRGRDRGARPRTRRRGDPRRAPDRDQRRRPRPRARARRLHAGDAARSRATRSRREAGRAVALALELDDELRREGLAREIVHAVQNARKEAGLDVSDRIDLTSGGDDDLLEAARAHEELPRRRDAGHVGRLRRRRARTERRDRGTRAADRDRAGRLTGRSIVSY